MARKSTSTGTTAAAVAYDSLTAKGQELMAVIGNWSGSFFDDGIVEGSGAWGEVIAQEGCVTATVKGMAGVLTGTKKAGIWNVTPAEQGDDSDFWYLTALGAEVALHAAAQGSTPELATPTKRFVEPTEAPKKVCRKDAAHEYRTTKSGGYCYTCDRVVAEAQKAARAAAK